MFEHLDDPLEFVPPEAFRRRATDRGRRLRARRRLTAVATTTVVVGVLAAAVLAAVPGTGDGDDVRTGPSDERREPRVAKAEAALDLPEGKLVREPHGLMATPATGLREGDQVTLALDQPTEQTDSMTFVCAAEVLDHLGEWLAGTDWCSEVTTIGPTDRATLTVERTFRAEAGRVDCADAPGRCLLAVAEGSPDVARFRYAPLAMAEGLGGTTPEVRVYGADGSLEDGDDIRIEAEGFPSRAEVRVALCTATVCDESVRGVSTGVDREGRLELDFRVFHEIQHLVEGGTGPNEIEWFACTDCRLEVGDGTERLMLPLEVEQPDDPIRPQVTVEGVDGPLAPGSTVRITGEGFQPEASDGIVVAWCPKEPGYLVPGVPSDEVGGCDSPAEGRPQIRPDGSDGPGQPTLVLNEDGYEVDDDGRFVIERFPLPDDDAELGGLRCAARPGSCTITWGDSHMVGLVRLPPAQVHPLDLSG